ncbi:MAG: hypothetical protein H6512_14995 [Acidimicrobiia bacterium]|nr:hypothetical protein [Acidimicrobiia bacterium]
MAENLPGGRAIRPGDVLRTRSGATVEVLNTDAEGRLILADALTIASEGEPDLIIDLATLTGACIVALGPDIAGVMEVKQSAAADLIAAGDAAGEAFWQLRCQLGTAVCSIRRWPTSATSEPTATVAPSPLDCFCHPSSATTAGPMSTSLDPLSSTSRAGIFPQVGQVLVCGRWRVR